MSTQITLDEWRSELSRLCDQRPPDDPGVTAEELAEAKGLHVRTVREILRKHRTQLLVGWRTSTRIDGHRCKVPCYRPLSPNVDTTPTY